MKDKNKETMKINNIDDYDNNNDDNNDADYSHTSTALFSSLFCSELLSFASLMFKLGLEYV